MPLIMTIEEIKHEISQRSDWLTVYGLEELEMREQVIATLRQEIDTLKRQPARFP